MAGGLEGAKLIGQLLHLPLPHLPHNAPVQDHGEDGGRGGGGAVQRGKSQGGKEAEQVHSGRRISNNLNILILPHSLVPSVSA